MSGRKTGILMTALLIVGALAQFAEANLVARSPNKIHGFPAWYQDRGLPRGGVRLELCLDPLNCQTTDPTANPFSVLTGFGNTAWYFQAAVNVTTTAGVIAEYKAEVTAAYTGGVIANGNQITRNRVLYNVKNLPSAGTYTVVHPYGRDVLTAVPAGNKFEITFLNSVEGRAPAAALVGPVGPYLQAVNPPPPVGFIGKDDILQTVKGSPKATNFFRIIGPAGTQLGGPAATPNIITIRQFNISGQVF